MLTITPPRPSWRMTVSGPPAPGVAGAGASPKGSGCTRAMVFRPRTAHSSDIGAGRRMRDVRPISNRKTTTLTNTRIPATATESWGTKPPVTDSSTETV